MTQDIGQLLRGKALWLGFDCGHGNGWISVRSEDETCWEYRCPDCGELDVVSPPDDDAGS